MRNRLDPLPLVCNVKDNQDLSQAASRASENELQIQGARGGSDRPQLGPDGMPPN